MTPLAAPVASACSGRETGLQRGCTLAMICLAERRTLAEVVVAGFALDQLRAEAHTPHRSIAAAEA